MPGEEISIGPFVGGLNTASDPTSIEDTELSQCVNFELDLDGSLVSRPPIVDLNVTMTLGLTGNMKVLGFYVSTDGAPYLIGSDGLSSTYYFDGNTWTLITNTVAASAMCQFLDSAWLLAPVGSANPGGKWSPSAGFTTEPNMPKGSVIISNKERLWVGLGKTATSNNTRLYLTDIVSGAPTWSSPASYVEVGVGDGQPIVGLAVYYSDLIIFKQGSTYRFAYDADPSVGVLARVSDNIGAADAYCSVSYENRLYILFDNKVYEFTNYAFDRLNGKVPLVANDPDIALSEYYTISVWADRLFVSYYDRTFVYSLKTRTWTEWQSDTLENIGRIITLPVVNSDASVAYTYSTKPRTNKLYSISTRLSDASEQMTSYLVTKNYDYQSPIRWKRLFMWGADVVCRTAVDVIVTPVAYSAQVLWGTLKDYTWGSLNTWGRPIEPDYIVTDSVMTEGLTGERKFVKFYKSLRFRQSGFKVSVDHNGSTAEAPVRVFGLVTGVRDKAVVTKRIS